MNIITGIVTYNRLEYLQKLIDSYKETITESNNHTLIVSDDNSSDGTKEYLNNLKINNLIIINNNRRGVHHQVNQILKKCSSMNFDIGFMAEDDIYFVKKGWDELYANSIRLSHYDHLCYFSREWANKYRSSGICHPKTVKDNSRRIQSVPRNSFEAFGCFWTFTKKVIDKVGYFDLNNFGLWGNGHTDYSQRCCNAGFNKNSLFCDALNSEDYIKMREEDYKSAISEEEKNIARDCQISHQHRGLMLQNNKRIYIPYNEMPYDMKGVRL